MESCETCYDILYGDYDYPTRVRLALEHGATHPWLDKDKALGLFRLALNDALKHQKHMLPIHIQVFLTETIAAIEAAALLLHERLKGEDR